MQGSKAKTLLGRAEERLDALLRWREATGAGGAGGTGGGGSVKPRDRGDHKDTLERPRADPRADSRADPRAGFKSDPRADPRGLTAKKEDKKRKIERTERGGDFKRKAPENVSIDDLI